jgi:hypothetical protein
MHIHFIERQLQNISAACPALEQHALEGAPMLSIPKYKKTRIK